MKQFIGISENCDIKEAVKGLNSPKLIILCVSEKELFQQKVEETGRIVSGCSKYWVRWAELWGYFGEDPEYALPDRAACRASFGIRNRF